MRKVAFFSGIALATGASLAGAITVFTDEAEFINTLVDPVIETFDQVDPGTVQSGETVDLSFSTFRYEGEPDSGNNDPFEGQPLFQIVDFNPLNVEFMGEVNADGTPSGLHFFDFVSDVTAFGGTFTNATGGARLTVTPLDLNGNSIVSAPLRLSDVLGIPGTSSSVFSNPGSGFFGFSTDTPFSSVQFGVEAAANDPNDFSSEVFRLDNVIANPLPAQDLAPVPLPSSIMFMLAGLAGLGFWRRRALS